MRAMKAARSLGERTISELILQHQNSAQLSANLWAAVRSRGCQFLGPGKFYDFGRSAFFYDIFFQFPLCSAGTSATF